MSSAAASVAVAALQEGHHVEYISGETLRLAPFADEGELLERLAEFQQATNPVNLDRLWRKSTLALFVDGWNLSCETLVTEAAQQRRRVAVYLPEGVPVPSDFEGAVYWFSADEIREQAEVRP